MHGLSGSWRWWSRALPLLARSNACHILDVPRVATPEGAAEWLAAWADAVGLDSFALVGHSLGGAAATRFAATRAVRVTALALVAPAGIPAERRLVRYARPLLSELLATDGRFLAQLGVDAIRARPAALLRGGLSAIRANLRDDARAVRARTLLVWGDRDALVPVALAEEWQAALPSSRLAVIPGVGHVPMVTRPREFSELLLEFLDETRDGVGGGPVSGVRSVWNHDHTTSR